MGVAHAKSDKNGGFWAFWAICHCLIDSIVVYSVSTHENLSFGTKFKSLWPSSGNLWPKMGQNLPNLCTKGQAEGGFWTF